MKPEIVADFLRLILTVPIMSGLLLCALILFTPSFQGQPYIPPLAEDEDLQKLRVACG